MNRWPSLAAVAVLALSAVILAWPLLFGDGWFTYQDNPCHLAALADLAAGSGGWTDAAMLGQPYAATHGPLWYGLLGRLVALKVLHPHLLAQPGFFKRFMREAEVGRQVQVVEGVRDEIGGGEQMHPGLGGGLRGVVVIAAAGAGPPGPPWAPAAAAGP